MLVIGLAGGIASGKSLVAHCFELLGAIVLDADRFGHEVLEEPDVITSIAAHWGETILRNGRIDRKALGRIVFDPTQQDASHLERLEQITHPRIQTKIRNRIAELKQTAAGESGVPAVVLDAPVMFKAGWDQQCDKIVFVESDISVREERARQRGWSSDELARRESFQTPLDEKRRRSTNTIHNSQSKLATFEQVRDLWQQWGLPLPSKLNLPTTLFSD